MFTPIYGPAPEAAAPSEEIFDRLCSTFAETPAKGCKLPPGSSMSLMYHFDEGPGAVDMACHTSSVNFRHLMSMAPVVDSKTLEAFSGAPGQLD
jgi:hypothetical protein